MENRGKLVLSVLAIMIVLSMGLAGGTYYLLSKEKARAQELGAKLEDVSAKLKIAEARFEETKRVIADIQLKYTDARQEIDNLNKSLEAEKSDKLNIQVKLEQVKADLEQQKALRQDLEAKLTSAQGEAQKVQEQIKKIESEKTDLQGKIKALEAKMQGVELGTIVVSPDASKAEGAQAKGAPQATKLSPVKKGLEGRVLTVKKENNFVILNIGAKDGVKVNDEFVIYHGGEIVADVKAEKLQDSMAAAVFLNPDAKTKVSDGDRAVQKVK